MMPVTIYEVKPEENSKFIWMMSGNKELMTRYASEMGGVVVEKVVG
jgi:hypothetical protein